MEGALQSLPGAGGLAQLLPAGEAFLPQGLALLPQLGQLGALLPGGGAGPPLGVGLFQGLLGQGQSRLGPLPLGVLLLGLLEQLGSRLFLGVVRPPLCLDGLLQSAVIQPGAGGLGLLGAALQLLGLCLQGGELFPQGGFPLLAGVPLLFQGPQLLLGGLQPGGFPFGLLRQSSGLGQLGGRLLLGEISHRRGSFLPGCLLLGDGFHRLVRLRLPGGSQGRGLYLGLAGAFLLLAQGLQLPWLQQRLLARGGGGVLQGPAHGTGLARLQGVGQLQGGVLTQQRLLALQPQGHRFQQKLLLGRCLLRDGEPFQGGGLAGFAPGQLLPGGGELFQGLAALQQSGQPGGGLLAGLAEGVALFHPLGEGFPLLPQSGQRLALLLQLFPGGGGLFPRGLGPKQLLFLLPQPGAFLGQGHRLLPQCLGLLPLVPGLDFPPLQLLPGGLGPGQGFASLLGGLLQPGVLLQALQQPLGLLQLLGQGLVLLAQGGLPLGQGRGFFLQAAQALRLLLLEQGGPQGGGLAGFVLQLALPLVEAVRHLPPHPGGKQGFQHLPLVAGAGPQQPQKLPLGQHNHLGELLAGQVEQLLGPAADGAVAFALQQGPVLPLQAEALVALPQLGGLGVAVDVGVLAAAKAVALPLQGELQLHQSGQLLGGAAAAHLGKAAPAPGGFAVQGKAHGVQQGGLPPAGGPGD